MKYSIFVCHDSDDRVLAAKLQTLLEKTLTPLRGEKLVFRSTDLDAVKGGADWYAAIIDALRNSEFCLSLLTPTSIHKPWVLFESGVACAVYRNRAPRLIALCASGMTPETVPDPFKRLQARCLYDSSELDKLVRQIAATLPTALHVSPMQLRTVVGLSQDITGGWNCVEPIRAAVRADLSPYRFDQALKVATQHVFVAGQNLHRIATTKETLDAIIEFLRAGKQRRIDILLCDARNRSAVRAWKTVNPELDKTPYTYRKQLLRSTAEFLALSRMAHKEELALTARVLDVVPFGATAIDPELDSGVIALQPVVNHGPKSGERPQFLITRAANREIFRYYWLNLETAFENAADLRARGKGS